MRTWGNSGAGAAIRRAQAASAYARRSGRSVDEADDILTEHWSRRRFLAGTGAAAMAAVPGVRAASASAAGAGRRPGGPADAAGAGRRPGGPADAAGAGRRPGGPADAAGPASPRVVIVGAGIAGLGCAYQLWHQHGIRSDVYEYNTRPGGRIRTLRGYFDDGQIVEEHAEFINPEHTATLALARSFGLSLDNCDAYPPGTHPLRETLRFHGRSWSQAALNRDWHDWGWKLFHDAAFRTAPWPQLHNHHNPGGRRFDLMSVTEWIDAYVPGGTGSDFGALCVSAVLDEFGGPPDETSSLNLVYLLGQDASTASGAQPRSRPWAGRTRSGMCTAGTIS